MARVKVNGRPLTVAEAIFLATSGSLNLSPGRDNYVTLNDLREVVRVLDASRSRDPNIDTARSMAHAELAFREKHGD